MDLVRAVLAGAIWVPFVGVARFATLRLVRDGRMSPRVGAVMMAGAVGALPIFIKVAAFPGDPLYAAALSLIVAVVAYRGHSQIFRRGPSEE